MGAPEIEAFLTHLAVQERVAASTQNQAFSALLFLYREVLRQELDESIDAVRAKQPRQLPTVLTKEEVRLVIQQLSGVPQLVIQVLYGSGVRLNEGLNLRVKDIDFAQHLNHRAESQRVRKSRDDAAYQFGGTIETASRTSAT